MDDKTQLASTFEPRVAEAVFDRLVAEAGVAVVRGRLDLERGVTKDGTRITTLQLEDGRRLRGRMFIDASYEGDLLAAAGVSYRIGREANSEFGESGNGITGPLPKNQLPDGIDPYVVQGDRSSGLLPGVNLTMGGREGAADHRLQAYCYRLVLTRVESSRVPIEKPQGYREADYELLFRAIEAGQTSRFFTTSPMPNGKTDTNNEGGISNDFIGGNYGSNWNWATLNHQQRAALADQVGIAAGHRRSARRRTDGAVRIKIRKPHAFAEQLIDVRRPQVLGAVRRKIAVAEVVDHDQQHIRLRGLRLRFGKNRETVVNAKQRSVSFESEERWELVFMKCYLVVSGRRQATIVPEPVRRRRRLSRTFPCDMCR